MWFAKCYNVFNVFFSSLSFFIIIIIFLLVNSMYCELWLRATIFSTDFILFIRDIVLSFERMYANAFIFAQNSSHSSNMFYSFCFGFLCYFIVLCLLRFVSVHQIISKYYSKRFVSFFFFFRFSRLVVLCFERIKCLIKNVFVRLFFIYEKLTDKYMAKVTFHNNNKNMHQRHHHEHLVCSMNEESKQQRQQNQLVLILWQNFQWIPTR